MLRTFQQSYHIPGTLTANITPVFTAPFDCQLVHVSVVGSNANNAQLKIGTTSSDAAYMALKDAGDSNVPLEYERDDFVGGQYPHIPDGSVVLITLDYDGAGGTAIQNATIVLTFTEG